MNYLILIDGILYGYDNADILKIDILSKKPSEYKIYKINTGMITKYEEINFEDLN